MQSLAISQLGTQIKIMEQLILRCQSDLNMYIRDEMLMHNHCMDIIRSLNLKMLETMLSVDD